MSELNGIYEHLNELRTRVLRVVIVVGIIAVFLMTFHFESISYGGIMFYYLLYTSNLIPKWLAGWGFIAIILLLIANIILNIF